MAIEGGPARPPFFLFWGFVMKRIVLATVVLLGSTAIASADPCTVTYLPGVNPTYAPDDSAISLFFDAFSATAGNSGTCATNFAAHSNVPNDPDKFEVYKGEVRGDIAPGVDDEAKVTVTTDGQSFSNTYKTGDNPVLTHYIGKDADGNLRSDITLAVTNATDPSTEAFLDSVDYSIAASMTRANAEASLDQVNLGELALITHLGGMTNLLTGGNLAAEGDNEFGVFGGVGSYQFGVRGRFNLAPGFSLLGGASIVDLSSTGATANGVVGAAAVRYVNPLGQGMRVLGEGGVELSALGLGFTRTYTDSTGAHTATGSGTGGIGSVYGKGGVIWSPDQNNEVLFSATVKEGGLGIGTYSEPFSTTNFFAADLGGTTTFFTTAKANIDWTSHLTPEVDLTASAGLGTAFANGGTTADIFGGGATTGAAQSTIFAEYGVRVGWMPTTNVTLDGFIQGTTGTNIGTHAQIGAGARMRF